MRRRSFDKKVLQAFYAAAVPAIQRKGLIHDILTKKKTEK
jgi:hypothetical protein